MPCFHPLHGYQTTDGSVVFVARAGRDYKREVYLPCGQCLGCRLERSRQWAVRIMHEAQCHESNSFVTLTYDQNSVPLSLRYSDVQRFFKRIRKEVPVRYVCCGEYGELNGRPHYHACLFGEGFSDRVEFSKGESGEQCYTSGRLSRWWTHGFATCGDLTFESAAYVARYILKKVTGRNAEDHYKVVLPDGTEVERVPEFLRMSLKPGIGKEWFSRYAGDVSLDGKVVSKGREVRAPRYYDRLMESADPDRFEEMQFRRVEAAAKYAEEQSAERLAVRERVAEAAVQFKKRS